jgi:hypothetical protein
MLAAVQASHQKMAWTAAGVDIKSQEAYDLAVQGKSRIDYGYNMLVLLKVGAYGTSRCYNM